MVAKGTIELLQQGKFKTKFRAGKYYHEVKVQVENGRLLFFFGYNEDLLREVKTVFEKRKYHGYIEGDGRKIWSVPITHRNLFQFEVLQGKYAAHDPYEPWSVSKDYSQEIVEFCQKRALALTPYTHQVEMVNLGVNSHWCIFAAEMGTGKTLASIILMEYTDLPKDIIWVGPRAPLVAARADFRKWQSPLTPEFMTYEGLKKLVEHWPEGRKPPRYLILDESSRCKTGKAQRTQAAQNMADFMRDTWGWPGCFIIELSGTPSPKSPADWHSQCEIACPGFLREADIFSFRHRLGHFYKEESVPGVGAFNKLHTWKDTEDKCDFCGEIKDHPNHEAADFGAQLMAKNSDGQTFTVHPFKPGVNEVEKLGVRMRGLAQSWLKKDCLDLPAKRYRTIELEPTQEVLNAARNIVETTVRGVDALIKLRTLSDGFLYEHEPTGEFHDCNGCKATGKVTEYFEEENPYDVLEPDEIEGKFRYIYEECPPDEDPIEFVPEIIGKRPVELQSREVDCATCSGEGKIEKLRRIITELDCPKIDLLKELLQEHEEVGRLNIYAGFEGSIIRVVNTCLQQGWITVKADGKGWQATHPVHGVLPWTDDEMIFQYQNGQEEHGKMAFVGQPGAAGMGLTLTASPSTFFYSNDFIPENREQAEDRGHRIGMDTVRGGVIIDCVHLPTDRKVIESLKKSRALQRISMEALRSLL